MRNRSRTEIVAQILEVANLGNSNDKGYGYYAITKTKIMHDASLTYRQMKEYLMILTNNDLLSYNIDTRTFKTTEKGQSFLRIYNQVGYVKKGTSLASKKKFTAVE